MLFKLFEHLLNGITPSGILKVPTTDCLLNFSLELIHGFDLRIIGLEFVKVNALKHL